MGDEKNIVWIEGRSFSSGNLQKNDWDHWFVDPFTRGGTWTVGIYVMQHFFVHHEYINM